MIERKAGDF